MFVFVFFCFLHQHVARTVDFQSGGKFAVDHQIHGLRQRLGEFDGDAGVALLRQRQVLRAVFAVDVYEVDAVALFVLLPADVAALVVLSLAK